MGEEQMLVTLRALLLLGGIFFILMGFSFLIDPVGMGGDFGLTPQGTLGLASIRADMTAFFVISGTCLVWGAWWRRGDPLLVTAGLMGIALLGRIVTLATAGSHEGWWQPMLNEAVTSILALAGSRQIGRAWWRERV